MTADSGEESAEDADRSREDRIRMEFQVAVCHWDALSMLLT